MTQTNEKAFETAIEDHLISVSGYEKGDREVFDLQLGLFPQMS